MLIVYTNESDTTDCRYFLLLRVRFSASLFLRAWLVRATNVNLRNGCGVCILTPGEDASRSWTEVVKKNGRCGFFNPPVTHMQNKPQTPHLLSTY